MAKGELGYIPKTVLNELKLIKESKDIQNDRWKTIAFQDMVNYSKVGRKVEEMRNRFIMSDVFNTPKKKKKQWDLL